MEWIIILLHLIAIVISLLHLVVVLRDSRKA